MKHDIKKLREEFEKQIYLYEQENVLNEGIKEYELSLSEFRGKVTANIEMPNGYAIDGVTREVAKLALTLYEPTDEWSDDKYVVPYYVQSERSYGDKVGKIHIQWMFNQYKMSMYLVIDEQLSNEFLNVRSREVTSSENSTYVSIHESRKYGNEPQIPVYKWKKNQIEYYGGHNKLIDTAEIIRFIEFLKK